MPRHCCSEMQRHLEEGEVAIRYVAKFREYGIPILDGGSATQEIHFCPWCGCPLPGSLRDRWFDEIESRGFDLDSEDLPTKYLTDEWWVCADLEST